MKHFQIIVYSIPLHYMVSSTFPNSGIDIAGFCLRDDYITIKWIQPTQLEKGYLL